MWHTYLNAVPFSPGSMFGHASTPKDGNISEVRICWIVILGGVPYIQILEKCIMILQFANFSRPGQCRVEMRTFRIKVLCLLQTTLLQRYINHADRNQKHARRIPSEYFIKCHSSGLAHIQIARYGKAFISKAGLTFSWKNCPALSDPPKTKSWPLRSSEDQTMRRLLSKWKTKCEMIIWCYSWTKINV